MDVKFVKVYLSGQDHVAEEVFSYLHELPVKGATMSRGIKSFGKTGAIQSLHLLDAHTNLPLVIEFFDTATVVDKAIKAIKAKVETVQLIAWHAEHH